MRESAKSTLEEVRAAVADDIEEEKKAEEEFARRFAGHRQDVRLVSGVRHAQAKIKKFSFDDLHLEVSGEPTVIELPWSLISPETTRDVAKRVYRNDTAQDSYDLGRFFVARRMWRDASDAFVKAKSLDEEYEYKISPIEETLDALVAGRGFFKGTVRPVPPNGLRLTYDLRDPAQSADFRGGDGLKIASGTMTMTAPKPVFWTLTDGQAPVEFVDEIDLEFHARTDSALVLAFHGGAETGYVLELGTRGILWRRGAPEGEPEEVAKNEKAVLGKTERNVRVLVRGRSLRVFLDGREALSATDGASAGQGVRGPLAFGLPRGSAAIVGPLAITGQLDPGDLQKRIGTVEMLVRRAVNPELEEIERLNQAELARRILGATEGLRLSADFFFTIQELSIQELADYDRLKLALAEHLAQGSTGRMDGKLDEPLDKLAADHPNFPNAFYLRGRFRLAQGDVHGARADLERAIELFPEFHEAHGALARAWEASWEFEKAQACAGRAIELRPDYADAYLVRGEMRFAADKSQWEQADLDLRLAGKLDADGAEVIRLRRWIKVQRKGPRDLGCIHEMESPHYRIVTDISAERAAWYARRLEIVRAWFEERFGPWTAPDPRPKPRIAIFNTREAFYTYSELSFAHRQEHALGFFAPQNNELVLFEDLDLMRTQETLYHEAFHHFASALLKAPPYWWNEGMAEYMSGVRIENGRIVEKARALADRLPALHFGLSAPPESGLTPSFEEIMNQPPREFYSGWIGVKYAQAWSMIHFFYEYKNGAHRSLIEAYFAELVAGKTPRQAYDHVFREKAGELEREWKEYAKGLKPPATP